MLGFNFFFSPSFNDSSSFSANAEEKTLASPNLNAFKMVRANKVLGNSDPNN